MVSVLIVGYRNFDLGIFNDKDPRIKIIKKAIQRDLTRLLEEGAEWLIFTGNLGFEVWALEVAKKLQQDRFESGISLRNPLLQKLAHVGQSQRNRLEEIGLALETSAQTIRPEHLQQSEQHKTAQTLTESLAHGGSRGRRD